jgi:hypothetical protein
MPQQLPNGHDLGALFEQIGRERMAQTVATRHDPRSVGIACHLFLVITQPGSNKEPMGERAFWMA